MSIEQDRIKRSFLLATLEEAFSLKPIKFVLTKGIVFYYLLLMKMILIIKIVIHSM